MKNATTKIKDTLEGIDRRLDEGEYQISSLAEHTFLNSKCFLRYTWKIYIGHAETALY